MFKQTNKKCLNTTFKRPFDKPLKGLIKALEYGSLLAQMMLVWKRLGELPTSELKKPGRTSNARLRVRSKVFGRSVKKPVESLLKDL